MKRLILCLMLFSALITAQGQTQITLTFQAKDSLTQNLLSLDSVNIRNLTENCDTTLYDAISILSLFASWPVGIDQEVAGGSGSFVLMQNVPNPFRGSTVARVYLKNPGELMLEIYDMSGNRLSGFSNGFERGWHLFGITTNKSQPMLLKVSDNTITKTIKILNTETGNSGDRITYIGHSGPGSDLKSTLDINGFIFYLGNQLQYTAHISGYQTSTVSDDPVSNETYTFAMLPKVFTCGDIVSYSGQDYNTILIGTQCWFKENLNAGTRIDAIQGQTNNSILEKFCYQDIESNCDVYGGLYQWDEAMQYVSTEGSQGICPDGWHIPKNDEYTTLSNFLGGNYQAGGKIKETGFLHWSPPNTGASNSSGFTALPGGLRDPVTFSAIQVAGYFWTSTQQNGNRWFWFVGYDNAILDRYGEANPLIGISIRCLKD